MQSEIFYPPPALRHVVKQYWTLQNTAEEIGSYRYFPDGCLELSFSLENYQIITFSESRGVFKVKNGVLGQFCRNFNSSYEKPQLTFLIKFHPWSLGAIIPENISNFTGSVTQIEWLSKFGDELRDIYSYKKDLQQVAEFANLRIAERLKIFEKFDLAADLTKRLEKEFNHPTNQVLSEYGLSKRRLEQIFKQHIGLSPKHYQRTVRFRHAAKCLKNLDQPEEEIFKLGYFDWSHFSKDMNYFTELSPTQFKNKISPKGELYNLQP